MSLASILLMVNSLLITQGSAIEEKIHEEHMNKDDKPYHNFRLSNYIVPKHYEIFLDVDMQSKLVIGKVKVHVELNKPTKYFYLHAFQFKSIVGRLFDIQNQAIPVSTQYLYPKHQYHVLETLNEVTTGSYVLYYEYSFELKKKLAGFYQAQYKTQSGETKLIAATQLCPVDARTMFPCFDEPAMRATFDITIMHGIQYNAISNMPVSMSWYNEKKDRKYSKFQRTPKMSTYLLAVVVCDFPKLTVIPDTRRAVRMSAYAPSEQLSQLKYAVDIAKQVLPFFEHYFNITYPLPQADMIAIPDFALNGMENWGLIAFRMKALLYDASWSSLPSKTYTASLISHEIAHMWFGDLVTIDWWDHIWLNEGFATFVQYLGVDSVNPEWRYLDFQVVNDMVVAMTLDAFSSSHPIQARIETHAQIGEIFDPISYQKGACVLRMLFNIMGDGSFVAGIHSYLKKYAFGNAKTEDLWKELTKASSSFGTNLNISNIMNTWVTQKGFPVIDVNRDSMGNYKLTQTKFTQFINQSGIDFKQKWMVPFTYFTLNITNSSNIIKGPTKLVWLNNTDAYVSMKIKDGIIKGNVGQYGFFRVNYDVEEWMKIILILKNNHLVFEDTDRAGFIQDAFALANSGRLPLSVALELFDYIDKERDFIPWKAACDCMKYILKVLAHEKRIEKLLRKFMLTKLSTVFMNLKFQPISGFLKRNLQILMISTGCDNNHRTCHEIASKMFNDWMKNGKPVPSDFRETVYHHGVQHGGQKEWNHVFRKYMSSIIPTQKSDLLRALCATRNPRTINRLLQFALNASIVRSQDVFYVFRYVSQGSYASRCQSWTFLKRHWDVIMERFGGQLHTVGRIIEDVASGFATDDDLSEVKDFFEKRVDDTKTVKRIITQTLESIQVNIEWLNINKMSLDSWLKSKKRFFKIAKNA